MANRDLTPWRATGLQPFGRDPFASFRREMDRLFDDFFAPAEARSFAPSAQGGQGAGMIMPSVDVHETDQAFMVTAELPGIDLKDVELSLDDNVLTLRGEKRSEGNEEQGGRRYSERSFGRFERSIPLPAEVDAERVEASCENGVLKVTLPKNMQARDRSRRIEIKGEGGSATAGDPRLSGRATGGQGSRDQTGAAQMRGSQAGGSQADTRASQASSAQSDEQVGQRRPTSDV